MGYISKLIGYNADMKEPINPGTYSRLLKHVLPFKYMFFLSLLGSAAYSGVDAYFTYLMKPLLNQGFINRDESFIGWLPFIIIGIFIVSYKPKTQNT